MSAAAIVARSTGAPEAAAVTEVNSRPMFRTIGILGGMGPQATMDFETRVHRVAQKRIPPQQNGGYPPMVVYYHRQPPFEVGEYHKPRLPLRPNAVLLDAAKRLGAWADFLLITSNGPHLIQQDIERASGRKVLSLIDVTVTEIERRHLRRVGVLGFGEPTIYTIRLAARGVSLMKSWMLLCERGSMLKA